VTELDLPLTLRGSAFGVLDLLVRRVGHGRDECGDDVQFVVGELVEYGVDALPERAEEGQAGGPSLVGVAQVDDPVVGGVVAGPADVAGLLEAVDDQAGAAGGQAEVLAQLPAVSGVPWPSALMIATRARRSAGCSRCSSAKAWPSRPESVP
jgi:hypothetical protein